MINTHVDGIGANVAADGSPTFPDARYLVPRRRARRRCAPAPTARPDADALLALQDDGHRRADPDAGPTVVAGVSLEDAPGHNPGHARGVGRDGGDESPSSSATCSSTPPRSPSPHVDNGDLDPVALEADRAAPCSRAASTDDALLIGPLFAAPGGGQVRPSGDTWRLDLPE